MKVILKRSTTDPDMIEIVTPTDGFDSGCPDCVMLWAVVHNDFIDDPYMLSELEEDGEVIVDMIISRRKWGSEN